MSSGKRKHIVTGALAWAIGLLCALTLFVIFYSTMVYQLSGEEGGAQRARLTSSPGPLVQGEAAGAQFPGALLALDEGALIEESAQDVYAGGETCRVVTRRYALGDGSYVSAVSAVPAAYLESLSEERFEPQLITGFMLAGMDAVYETRAGESLLAARDGDFVYLLRASVGEQEIYAHGLNARLEER